jgi:acetyl-CoA acetyltransferase
MSPSIPVIVGVGDFINRSTRIEDAEEPLSLMLSAIETALADTGLDISYQSSLRESIDSIATVLPWTWDYPDLPGTLASRLGCKPTLLETTNHGGHQPVRILDEAARRIARGSVEVAVVTGGESLASCIVCSCH